MRSSPVSNLRLVPEACSDGPTNMALDEALLECAEGPTLRLYTWACATVSLGYFQDAQAVRATLPAGAAGMPLVRRITGGGAIWHEHEVTYCLVAELGTVLPAQVRSCYPLLHRAVLEQLAERGAQLTVQATPAGDRRYRLEPRCFASPAPDDLTARDGGKVLGSAARQRGRRLLMHGSLKLASNPWDEAAVAGCHVAPLEARRALERGLAQALGLMPEPGALSPAELAAMERIREARYATTAWVDDRGGPMTHRHGCTARPGNNNNGTRYQQGRRHKVIHRQ